MSLEPPTVAPVPNQGSELTTPALLTSSVPSAISIPELSSPQTAVGVDRPEVNQPANRRQDLSPPLTRALRHSYSAADFANNTLPDLAGSSPINQSLNPPTLVDGALIFDGVNDRIDLMVQDLSFDPNTEDFTGFVVFRMGDPAESQRVMSLGWPQNPFGLAGIIYNAPLRALAFHAAGNQSFFNTGIQPTQGALLSLAFRIKHLSPNRTELTGYFGGGESWTIEGDRSGFSPADRISLGRSVEATIRHNRFELRHVAIGVSGMTSDQIEEVRVNLLKQYAGEDREEISMVAMGGQSNAEGLLRGESYNPRPGDDDVLIANSRHSSGAFEGVAVRNGSIGPDASLATARMSLGRPTAVVKFAVGGSSLDPQGSWSLSADALAPSQKSAPGAGYQSLRRLVNVKREELVGLGYEPKLEAVVFWIGETAAGSLSRSSNFGTRIKALRERLRFDVNSPSSRFMLVRIDWREGVLPFESTVRESIREVAEAEGLTSWIDIDDLDGERVSATDAHHNVSARIQVGERLALIL